MANNSDLGCNCPCPDSGPDKNTETVSTTGDLNPMVYLSKLKNVQEHFGRQMLDVQFMLGRMETRAIRAETALFDSEKTIKKIVGTKAEMEKTAEKTAKKNSNEVGRKESVTIATGPDNACVPAQLPSRNNSVVDDRSSALETIRSNNGPSGLPVSNSGSVPIVNNSLDTSGASTQFIKEKMSPTVVSRVNPNGSSTPTVLVQSAILVQKPLRPRRHCLIGRRL